MSQLSFDKADELRQYLFAVLESLPQGIVLANNDGEVQAVNTKARQFLSLLGSSIQALDCWSLLHQAMGIPENELIVLHKNGGQLIWRQKRNGSLDERIFAISRNEMQSPFQIIAGSFFLTIEDITYLALLENQVERQRRLSAMQAMASTMNEELKNPLGGIELYASMLQRELADNPDNERLAVKILNAVQTMDHMLHNYLTYASLPMPQLTRVEMKEWLSWLLTQLKSIDKENKFQIKLESDLAHQVIMADLEMLKLFALNAGLNAMESMPAGGEIIVRAGRLAATKEAPACFEIQIIDHGCGISEEQLPKIFDPFYTTKQRANGMGLAIIHYIVETHNGALKIDSQLEKGTVLTALLPDTMCH